MANKMAVAPALECPGTQILPDMSDIDSVRPLPTNKIASCSQPVAGCSPVSAQFRSDPRRVRPGGDGAWPPGAHRLLPVAVGGATGA
jgi:hypothetical protein